MSAARPKPTPLAQLKGVVTVLENRRQQTPAKVLEAVSVMVRDAIEVLQEPDPLRRRIDFAFLAIRQSTEVRTYTQNGKELTRVRVVDLELYNWAMAQVHEIARAAA